MTKFIIGIDEVGRGPLAGPITVTALALPTKYRQRFKDSKKLSHRQRASWLKWIDQADDIFYATASVYPGTIDRINITKAANLAATRALSRLLANGNWQIANDATRKTKKIKVWLDGGLYLNTAWLKTTHTLHASTIVRGDEKYNAIKLASVVAKVKRDALMARYHKKYPNYGLDNHKGYGTKQHLAAIRKCGPSKIHRLTFLKNCSRIISKS
ncbi:MAG: ribonuclease HII [bacterium]|nr:ribonuclease HII [bacterium]